MVSINKLYETVEENKEELIGLRRDFHKHPEVGFDLERTAKIVADKLREYGLDVYEDIGKIGVLGMLKGKSEGPTVALRADMDALPIAEENNVPYKSIHTGKMHACGHDGHTAMLLIAAKVLSKFKNQLNGTVKFIFQPAEEGPSPGGAKPMIDDGVLESVNAIFGLHLSTAYETGTLAINRGSAMASADVFEVDIIGKGGHAGLPHESVDAIAMAAKVINDIQYFVSRETDPLEPVVISVGTIKGGFASNVVAGKVTMTGTIRTHSNQMRWDIMKKLESIVKHATAVSKGTYNFKVVPGLPPLINKYPDVLFAQNACVKVVGEENVKILDKPSMGAEDFAFYVEKIPGAFLWLGAKNESKGLNHLMHHPKFDFDEDALTIGSKVYIQLAVDYLNQFVKS